VAALRRFHGDWGYVAIVLNGLAGAAMFVAWRWEQHRKRWTWWVTIAAELAMMLQVLVGVILVSSHRYSAPRFHMFYGFVAFITVGLAYSYRYQMEGRLELLYMLVGFFLMGVGIRAVLQAA
jgi:4-hydroxybenzoate polyprenyltransferase